MKLALAIMTGIGFTFGVLFGLLLQLPSDSTLPAEPAFGNLHLDPLTGNFRSRRSLSDGESGNKVSDVSLGELSPEDLQQLTIPYAHDVGSNEAGRIQNKSGRQTRVNRHQKIRNSDSEISDPGLEESRVRDFSSADLKNVAEANTGVNPIIGSARDGVPLGNTDLPREALPLRPEVWARENLNSDRQPVGIGADANNPQQGLDQNSLQRVGWSPDSKDRPALIDNHKGLNHHTGSSSSSKGRDNDSSNGENPVRLTINIKKDWKGTQGSVNSFRTGGENPKSVYASEEEDVAFLHNLVNGVTWTQKLESSCPISFISSDEEAWRQKATDLHVVRMEQGCGRMQNRLLTFRDASKACARYRLNTDQIQGEIYSYYLSKLLNISNIPPTILVQVNSVSPKWRTVHLNMSLAHWADNKLVVLTQYIPNLSSAFIPVEFRGESARLEPTLRSLGTKSQPELCELLQWSDLIVLDYLTANLDRVINNMFNKQWNDQMMSNPAHNLEKFENGGLVFLDNESGLFHGYRLLDKYSSFQNTLLQSGCVFRKSLVDAVKRLHKSRDVGRELHSLFSQSEAVHEQLAGIPEKNLKVLQQRLDDVYEQIVKCEQSFSR